LGAVISAPVFEPSDWADVESVPLFDVAQAAHVHPTEMYNVIRRGFVQPLPRSRRNAPVSLAPAEARKVLTAAALAVAAGFALATGLRAVEAGATFPLATDTAA